MDLIAGMTVLIYSMVLLDTLLYSMLLYTIYLINIRKNRYAGLLAGLTVSIKLVVYPLFLILYLINDLTGKYRGRTDILYRYSILHMLPLF